MCKSLFSYNILYIGGSAPEPPALPRPSTHPIPPNQKLLLYMLHISVEKLFILYVSGDFHNSVNMRAHERSCVQLLIHVPGMA